MGVIDYHIAGYSIGARVAIQLATERVLSVIAIAPMARHAAGTDSGLGRADRRPEYRGGSGPYPNCSVGLSWVGRSVFVAGNRSPSWQLQTADARQLLTDYADAPGYDAASWASMFDMATTCNTITASTLLVQRHRRPPDAATDLPIPCPHPRWAASWLLRLNHVPISDDPPRLTRLMLTLLNLVLAKKTAWRYKRADTTHRSGKSNDGPVAAMSRPAMGTGPCRRALEPIPGSVEWLMDRRDNPCTCSACTGEVEASTKFVSAVAN